MVCDAVCRSICRGILLSRCRAPVRARPGGCVSELAEFLRSTELFGSVDAAALDELLPDMSEAELSAGQVLVSQGDLSQNLYFLLSGGLGVTGHNERNQPRLLLEVQPRESVGEMAVLSDDPAPATIQATIRSRVLALP